MTHCLISVIVPIYNTEKFLNACLDSLLAQTFQDYEAILVDDGSTDGSGRICDSYAEKDCRIHVIHQKNAGVSVARNRALEKVSGEYVFFLDSDDILPENAFEKLVHTDADLIIGSIWEVDEYGRPNGISQCLPNQSLSRVQVLEALFDESQWGYQGYIWNKLYRRSVIVKQNIRFDPVIKYNEDRLFLVEYLLSCSKVIMTSEVVYYYRQQKKSALAQVKLGFKPGVLTELDAFESMKVLVKEDYPRLYQNISRLAFEKSLYWLNKIDKGYPCEKKKVRSYVFQNARVCLRVSGKSPLYKIKLIAHCVLKR